MSGRWWRAYDDALHDPKVQLLPPPLFKRWFNLLCIASKHGGQLPPNEELNSLLGGRSDHVYRDVQLLVKRGLIDDIDGKLIPHNWFKRQYKSDNSTPRVQAYREAKGNVSETADVTAPEYRVQNTERKKDPVPTGTDANASPDTVRDIRADLFDRGRLALERITGKTPDSCRSLIGRWLKAVDDEAIHVLAAIDDAEQQRVADPVAWINRRLQPRAPPALNGRPLTFREQEKQQTREVLDALERSIERDRETSGQAHLRLLPRD